MKRFLILIVAALALTLAGCGERVTVPPVTIAKIMDKGGYEKGTVSPSTFRLDACWAPGAVCQKLVLLSVSDFTKRETMKLFMPQDKLEMGFSFRMTLTPKPDGRDQLFNVLTPVKIDNTYYEISNKVGYDTYVQPVAVREARDFMSQYSITDIANNREAISNAFAAHMSKVIQERTPYLAKLVDLDETEYPSIITKAQERAAERREDIQREEAEKEVNRVRMEKEYELAEKRRAINVLKAEGEAQVNHIIAESVTPSYERYRMLEALDKFASSDNTKIIPSDMLNSIASQVMVGNEASK